MAIADQFLTIQSRIHAACARTARDTSEVTLLAVSKGQPIDAISEAVALGQIWFGESKVQEAKSKIPLAPSAARWQMIGHLQSNKARDAVHLFEMIQSVDSLKLAEELNKVADKSAKTVRILLEVNVAGESSKFGYSPTAMLEEFLTLNALPRLEIHGMMTIAPWSPTPERSRSVFRRLRELRTECEQRLGAPLPVLSMGMSDDFEIAIEEGSTMVRVGTALFGTRSYPKRELGTAVEGD